MHGDSEVGTESRGRGIPDQDRGVVARVVRADAIGDPTVAVGVHGEGRVESTTMSPQTRLAAIVATGLPGIRPGITRCLATTVIRPSSRTRVRDPMSQPDDGSSMRA